MLARRGVLERTEDGMASTEKVVLAKMWLAVLEIT